MDTSKTLLVPAQGAGGSPRVRKASLTILEGGTVGEAHEIRGDSFVLGSAQGCDLRLEAPGVSRRHCRISVDAREGYVIEDLDSTNGTFVNGVRVAHAFLMPGAELQLGSVRLAFSPEDESRSFERSDSAGFGPIVGNSSAMRRAFYVAESYAATEATIMLVGETGTGKESFAREIHARSPRADKPLVVVDCATLAPESAEAELFGCAKELLSGATRDQPGAFGRAKDGTILLDDVGALPVELQPKLLRVLETGEYCRRGSDTPRKASSRILCATDKRLDGEVNEGRFREDLFFRLSVVTIDLPPLRDRTEDIPLLVRTFARRLHETEADGAFANFDESMAVLRRQSWPGNVRELRNLVDRAFYSPVRPIDLSACLAMGRNALSETSFFGSIDTTVPFKEEKSRLVDRFEKRYFTELLRRNGGNISASAREAGIERAYLQRLVKKLDIH